MPVPTLYYAAGACSLAPHIALEETGASFDAVRIDTASGEQRGPAYLRINPKSRVPALAMGDWVLTENPAILQFVGRSYPDARLWPDEIREQTIATEWLAWLASTIHVAYAHVRRADRYATSETGLADVTAKGIQTSREQWRAVETRLRPGAWAVGDRYSVVDAYLLVFWTWGRRPDLGLDIAETCPAWTDHARRMAGRPAVERVFAREGLTLPG